MSKLKIFNGLAITAFLLAACAAPATPTAAPVATNPPAATSAPADTAAPAATSAPAATAAPAATSAPAATQGGTLADVPRNQTLILGWGNEPVGISNPWANPGYTHQNGNSMLWDMLEYYGIYGSNEIPWLADSMDYNADFTQLTIKLNKDAAWSDGQPLTSKDLDFTFNAQMTNPKLSNHADFQQFVKDWTMPDAQTVILNFKLAAPRFKYEILTGKFDTGMEVVPEHVLGNTAVVTDVNAYQGGMDMPHSGPYTIVAWDATQKIMDLNPNWWAIKAGKITTPAVKRVIMVNIMATASQNMDAVVQRMVNNEFDAMLDVRASVIKSILDKNPKITSWTGKDPPGGNLDWWPNSLWMNTQLAPYNDPNVRQAICDTIDRNKINEVVYDGAKVATVYPFPLYPNLQKFADSDAVKAAFDANASNAEKTGNADLDETTKLMTAAGFAKNADGLWAKGGATVNATIEGFPGIHGDIAPVLVEMLKNGGFDASVDFGNSAYQNMADGKPGLYLFGHGASTIEPYSALNLFNSAYAQPIGTTAGSNRFSRYQNPTYDALLSTMAPLQSTDPAFLAAGAKAMGIYWKDTIDCPVIQWLHRIPYNQTYWTNWPLASNLADGENGSFWHFTGMIVVTHLKPVQ